MPTLSQKDLERFTVVDHRDRVAFVVLVGERIIAVGRYDRTDDDTAEVAFNVSDSRQGTGLGSVLLEHLAAAARERGIRTFTAEVLPQNTKMLNVFTDAGFDVERTYDDGVVLVSFSIDPTERSLAVMAEREHAAEATAMERLLHPESILLVGVSTRGDSPGGRILAALERSEFPGAVHLVARDAFEIRGHRTHHRIADVPGPVDLAVLAVRPDACLEAVEDCAAIGVRSVVIPTETFASAPDGAQLQRRLLGAIRGHGMRLLGPGSFGFLRTGDDGLNISLAPGTPTPGRTALAGQSSALSAMLLAGVDARGTGVSEFVSVGNRADVSLNDCLQHWEGDPDVDVIGLALESMGNPRKFTRIARRLTRSTPLIVMRPPATGSSVPPGHLVRTSTLPRRALDQVLASAGVVQATQGVDHLLDITDAIARQGLPQGPRVGLLTNTPALGEALRGAADTAHLDVRIDNRSVPLTGSHRLVERAFTSMAALDHVDLVVAGVLDTMVGEPAQVIRQMATVARNCEVALLVCLVTTRERMEQVRQAVRDDPVLPPVFATPYAAVRAGAGMLAAALRPHVDETAPPILDGIDPAGARRLVEEAIPAPHGEARMDATGVMELLEAYGITVLPSLPASDEELAVRNAEQLGYPVALKSSDPILRHRADLGGVRLDLADASHVRHAHREMRKRLAFSSAPLHVQSMAEPGVPMVVRTVEDPALGPVISLSVAGDATDLLDDIAYAIPPLSMPAAHRLIDAPAASARLDGRRGLPPADRDALADLLVRVGRLAEDLPEVASLELYPVIVAQHGCVVVGADATVATAPNRTDSARRTLAGPVDTPPDSDRAQK